MLVGHICDIKPLSQNDSKLQPCCTQVLMYLCSC